jgi:hypothetical protein
MFVEYFNTASITVMAFFAFFGVVAILSKKLRARLLLLSAFCVAALVAFALEATVFNFPHYLKYFAGPQTGITGVSETDPTVLLTTDGTRAKLIESGIIRFDNLNRKVTSVYVDINFGDIEQRQMTVKWIDEGATQQYAKTLSKYLPYENYAPLQPCGKVSELTITFKSGFDTAVRIREIVINKPIPFYFSGLRLFVVSLLFFALFALVNKNLRAKAAYYLFECTFDPKNRKQNIIYACTVALLILYSGVCVYTSVSNTQKQLSSAQYHKHLVDALIAGRTYLDYGNPEKLLTLEHPYDDQCRIANGCTEVFDWAWYKGKYYCYFGIVPAMLLYVPYKLITGDYLTDYTGVFLFSALAVILLALLWRYCVKKYMQGIRYALYLLALPTLFFASGITIMLRYPAVYSIVQCAGFMFTVAGVLLLLKSTDHEKTNYLKLFFACLCLALVFGCRPNIGLASLFVPVILWKRRSWKLCAFVMLPYVLVAIPLCVYNYVRFESIFDFGATYNLTDLNLVVYVQQNVLGKVIRILMCSAYYLFCPNQFSINFPFVTRMITASPGEHISHGFVFWIYDACGIINFPIVFYLSYLFKNLFNKNRPGTFYVLLTSLIIAVAIIVLNSMLAGVAARYLFDFATFITFPALFCAYYWCKNTDGVGVSGGSSALKNRLSLTYILIAVSIFVGLFISVTGLSIARNLTLHRYLEYSLGFFGGS